MRIGYVTTYDPRDRHQWSGLGYYVAHALRQQQHCVKGIGPLRKLRPWMILGKKALYTARRQGYLADRDCRVVRGFSQQAARRLEKLGKLDVVVSPGTIPVAYLETSRPIAVWTDSAFAGMIDFYPDFTHLCDETLRSGDQIEAAALSRARLIVYSSEWAARTAHQVYGVPWEKLHVVPFGANLDQTPTLEEVRCMIAARSRRVCKLVFLGVDWYRKGGDVALAVARQLNAQGVPTTLLIAGSRPPGLPRYANGSSWPTWLSDQGTISKRSPSRLAALSALLGDAHFLILPTRADCTPVTFSEANAFGVPVLSSQVGGIPSIIREGINGATFGAGDIAGYCDQIATWFSQPERYREVALAAYNEYATRLNWSTAAGEVTRLLEGIA